MSTPEPFEVFCFYHLGLDREMRYRFRNLHDAAEYFGLKAPALRRYLDEHGLDAETVRHIDFNLSRVHADAQDLELRDAPFEERLAFARDAWQRFLAARGRTRRATPYEDHDYDDLLGMKSR